MLRSSIALLTAGLMLTTGWAMSLSQAQQPQPPARGVQIPAKAKAAIPAAKIKALVPPAAKAAAAPTTKAAAPAPAPAAAADRTADEAAIRDLLQKYGKAYNSGQAEALTALMTDDVELVDGDGNTTRTAKEVGAIFASVFAEGAPATLRAKLESLRFLAGDVAQVHGQFHLGPDDAPVEAGRFSILVSRNQGHWKIAELRDYPLGAGDTSSNYEHLKGLEWMVGDWVSEGGDSKTTSKIQWALNKNFLVREYGIEVTGEPAMTGVMYLGWDAQTGQIKSWVFDSEGGHSQAFWIPAGDDQWIIKTQGSLRDGGTTSATQVLTRVNNDAVKHHSLDRILDGQISTDSSEVLMVRKPAGPGRD